MLGDGPWYTVSEAPRILHLSYKMCQIIVREARIGTYFGPQRAIHADDLDLIARHPKRAYPTRRKR